MTSLFRLRAWLRVAAHSIIPICSMLYAGTCQRAFDGNNTVLQMNNPSGDAGADQDFMPLEFYNNLENFDPSSFLLSEASQADFKNNYSSNSNPISAPALGSPSSQSTVTRPSSPPLRIPHSRIVLPSDDVRKDTAIKLSILNIVEEEAKTSLQGRHPRVYADSEIVKELNQNGYQGITFDMVRRRRGYNGGKGLNLPPGTKDAKSAPRSRRTMYQSGEPQKILDLIAKARAKLEESRDARGTARKRLRPGNTTNTSDNTLDSFTTNIPPLTHTPLLSVYSTIEEDMKSLSITQQNNTGRIDNLENEVAICNTELQKLKKNFEELSKKVVAIQHSIASTIAQASCSSPQQKLLKEIQADIGYGLDHQKDAQNSINTGIKYKQLHNYQEAIEAYEDAMEACREASSFFKKAFHQANELQGFSRLKSSIESNIMELQTTYSKAQKGLSTVHLHIRQLWERSQQAQQIQQTANKDSSYD